MMTGCSGVDRADEPLPVNGSWNLVQWTDSDGSDIQFRGYGSLRVLDNGEEATGGICNGFRGAAAFAGSGGVDFNVRETGTEMGCIGQDADGNEMGTDQLDGPYASSIGRVDNWSVEADQLILTADGDDQTRLAFERAPEK